MNLLIFTLAGLYMIVTIIPTFIYTLLSLGIILDLIFFYLKLSPGLSHPAHYQGILPLTAFLLLSNFLAFRTFWKLQKES